jgi:hypothetical protein
MNFVYLVKLVVSWENREQRDYFKQHAPHTPQVHFVSVIAVCEQALGGAVPSGRDVLGVWLFTVDAAARAEVSKLDLVVHKQDVLWFDISVENAVTVHVVDRLE